jgi:di/tricarboxylate transporter
LIQANWTACCDAGKAIGGKTAALGSMYLVTGILSEVLTNNAAAALMYPIAANVGDDMGIQVRRSSLAVDRSSATLCA